MKKLPRAKAQAFYDRYKISNIEYNFNNPAKQNKFNAWTHYLKTMYSRYKGKDIRVITHTSRFTTLGFVGVCPDTDIPVFIVITKKYDYFTYIHNIWTR